MSARMIGIANEPHQFYCKQMQCIPQPPTTALSPSINSAVYKFVFLLCNFEFFIAVKILYNYAFYKNANDLNFVEIKFLGEMIQLA